MRLSFTSTVKVETGPSPATSYQRMAPYTQTVMAHLESTGTSKSLASVLWGDWFTFTVLSSPVAVTNSACSALVCMLRIFGGQK